LQRDGRRHRVDEGVDLDLGELGQHGSRLGRAAGERARLLERGQIAI
jgi:hypothetical protein